MLLTITTTHHPATDLGYLLHKHPARTQTFNLAFGQGHVFYPEATDERCTAALLLDVNPVQLVRRDGKSGFALEQYVNDRPYAASSFLSVAISDIYRSALSGSCKERPDVVEMAIPLEVKITGLPSHGGEELLRKLFEPLGYTLTAERYTLDSEFPSWGESKYFTVTLSKTERLHEMLSHIYVLIPVLDNHKHYFVGSDEVEKLLHHGEGWLETHPEQKLITRRYLKSQRTLVNEALSRLIEPQIEPDEVIADLKPDLDETLTEAKLNLHQQRLGAAMAVLRNSGARRVVDLGCGEGKLLSLLLKEQQFIEILGMDVTHRTLDIAADKLNLDRLPTLQRQRIKLIHGSLMYRDPRLSGYDAAAVIEVIEHLDPPRLAAFERVLFEFARPQVIVLTTPNADYNVKWESLAAGQFRHKDHRFEWTRAEFQAWAQGMAERFGYRVRFLPIGPEDEGIGAPSQMGVFEVV